MKKIILSIFLFFFFQQIFAQTINGEVLYSDDQFEVIVVHGTHSERGYAVGFLLADRIADIFNSYLLPAFGSYYETGRMLIQTDAHISIDDDYKTEAEAMADAINDAGVMEMEVDYVDILLANSFLDLQNFVGKDLGLDNGCSSFINWGEATQGTSLNGTPVISRHLDWSNQQAIIRNQVLVVHIPSEENLQPWLLIGFAGQMSVLSGLNASGVAVMQHVLSDVNASASFSKGYEPIWFSLRKAIECDDFNNDGNNDALDIDSVAMQNHYGYADSYIITGVAGSYIGENERAATIIEVAPASPYATVRNTDYDDNIPGTNLYAANYAIARNNAQHYCTRYNGVKNNMGDGTMIGIEENWNIMLDYSSMCALHTSGNIQFMQYIPSLHELRLSYHTLDGDQACENEAVIFDTDVLFQLNSNISAEKPGQLAGVIYTTGNSVFIKLPHGVATDTLKIYNSSGIMVQSFQVVDGINYFARSELMPGMYIMHLTNCRLTSKTILD
ncbi:MAG: hypothetical protein KBB11_09455 [Bacteroidales bacterium]|nr:hypothetical protein [Bacteroidales bacterium]